MAEHLAEVQVLPGGDGEVVVTVRGEVDLSNAADVGARLDAVSTGADRVVVDLQEVAFIDTSGLRMLTELAGRPGLRLRVVAGPGTVARSVLRITGLDRALDVVEER